MVEFTSGAMWYWAFLCGEIFDYCLNMCITFRSIQILNFILYDSVLIGCVFLGIYPFLLGYSVFYCIIIYSNLMIFFISVASIVISPLISEICYLSLFFLSLIRLCQYCWVFQNASSNINALSVKFVCVCILNQHPGGRLSGI